MTRRDARRNRVHRDRRIGWGGILPRPRLSWSRPCCPPIAGVGWGGVLPRPPGTPAAGVLVARGDPARNSPALWRSPAARRGADRREYERGRALPPAPRQSMSSLRRPWPASSRVGATACGAGIAGSSYWRGWSGPRARGGSTPARGGPREWAEVERRRARGPTHPARPVRCICRRGEDEHARGSSPSPRTAAQSPGGPPCPRGARARCARPSRYSSRSPPLPTSQRPVVPPGRRHAARARRHRHPGLALPSRDAAIPITP